MKVKATTKDGKMTIYLAGELDHNAAREAMFEIERQKKLHRVRRQDFFPHLAGIFSGVFHRDLRGRDFRGFRLL